MGIVVENVSKNFGDFVALENVSLEVPSGSLTALLGPSGGGKSTLLRVIAGLEEPDSGTVILDGQDLTASPARERGVGFVFQHYAAFKHMTVRDNVAYGLKIRKRPKDEIAGPRRGAARARPPGRLRATAIPRSSQAASASAWRSPARSRSSRR